MGTHLDGLNHLQEGDRTYNGSLTRNIHRLDPVPPLSAHNLPLCDRCAQPVTARRVPLATGMWSLPARGSASAAPAWSLMSQLCLPGLPNVSAAAPLLAIRSPPGGTAHPATRPAWQAVRRRLRSGR